MNDWRVPSKLVVENTCAAIAERFDEDKPNTGGANTGIGRPKDATEWN
ncbi:MAG: hypothetical protein QOD09_2211 [Bradyrhizobium sp.]|jgi:hypothetical protein|nr:hypothetical protein [Bradyrhizobium sp.]